MGDLVIADLKKPQVVVAGVFAAVALLLCAAGGVFAQTPSAPEVLNPNGFADAGDDSRPQIVTDGAGNWVAVWDSFEDLSGTMSFDFDIFVSRSSDNGETWTVPVEINSDATTDSGPDRRPILVTDGAGMWITVWESENEGGDLDIFYSRSTNNGATWSARTLLNGYGTGDTQDDEIPHMATDGAGNWIIVWDSGANVGGAGFDLDIVLSQSSDNGATWSAPAVLNTNAPTDDGDDFRAQVTTDRDGNWVAIWASNDDLAGGTADLDLLVSRSADNGTTWTAPERLNTNGATDTGDDLRPGLETDRAGNWIAVWASTEDLNGTAGVDLDIFVSRSADNGATWTAPAVLHTNGTTDVGGDEFPRITSDLYRNWIVIWNSEEDLGGVTEGDWDIFYSRSTDNGASWSGPAVFNANGEDDSNVDLVPQTATDAAGNWVGVWESNEPIEASGFDYDIMVSRFFIDASPPAATTITPATTGPTNASSVSFTVTFSEVVSGFNNASDVVVAHTGTANSGVNISGGPETYTVNVTGLSGTGSFTLAVASNSDVVDGASNPLEDSVTSASVSIDRTAPTVTLASTAGNPVNGAITVSAALSETSTNFVVGDISTVNAAVSNFSGSGTSYSFTLTPDDDGLFSATVNAGTFTDTVGNDNTASNTLSRTADLTVPTIALSSAAGNPVNGAIAVTVAISESTADFVAGDITPANATVSNFAGSGDAYSFTLTPSANGTFSATVNAGVFTDAATNGNTASNTLSRTADFAGPTVSLTSATPNPTNNGTIPVTVIFSEAVTGFTADDVTPGNATVSDFSGSGMVYSFNLVATSGGVITASVAANAATDTLGNGNTASNQFSRTYNAVPLINLINDVTVSDGVNYSVTPTLVEGTGPITWTLTAPASPPSDMEIDPSTGEVTWTASYFFSPVDVTITATGPGGSDNESWRITVLPPAVWVDFAYTGTELGTNAQPFNTLAEAVAAVVPGDPIRIKGNTAVSHTLETPTLSTPMRIDASGGAVRIGGPFESRSAGGGAVAEQGALPQGQTGFVKRRR